MSRLPLTGAGPSAGYSAKVLRYSPIAYWPLWEATGTNADNLEGTAARDGTYSGATLGQTGIGDGNTSVLLGGDGDHVNVYSASLNTAMSKSELTIAGWFKVYEAATWGDDTQRNPFTIYVDANNFVIIERHTSDNQFSFAYKAGGTADWVHETGLSGTGWYHFALAVSKTGDTMKGYINGAQVSTTQSGIGTWVGNLPTTGTCIGVAGTGGANPWKGWLAHTGIWDTPLTATQIADLATV